MRAEDILPEDVNQTVMNGVLVRKGSVGAFLANARIILNSNSIMEDRMLAKKSHIFNSSIEGIRNF